MRPPRLPWEKEDSKNRWQIFLIILQKKAYKTKQKKKVSASFKEIFAVPSALWRDLNKGVRAISRDMNRSGIFLIILQKKRFFS